MSTVCHGNIPFVQQTTEKQMKTLTAFVLAVLVGATAASAHEKHEHAEGAGLFGQPPEYVHVLLNPLPVYGLALGIFALGGGLIARSKPARAIALGIIFATAASAWPVAHYGHNAYARVREKADETGQLWLDEHMERAEKSIYAFYVTAALAAITLAGMKKLPKAATLLAIATLVAAVVSVGLDVWISKAGGQIRHPEFRAESASSTNAPPHEHGAMKQAHQGMQSPDARGEHKHEETSESFDGKIPIPETLEGISKGIHAYHRELESAVNAKKFSEVQSNAKTIGSLAKRLVEVAPADRKTVIENGVTKINQALAELRSSAETGSDSVMEMRLKEFEQALQELEQQITKQ